MKLPGPDQPDHHQAERQARHRALQRPAPSPLPAGALVLQEASYPAVYYIPRADVTPGALVKTTHSSHCPYKGDASYFTIVVDGKSAENAVWSYETPFPAMAEIKSTSPSIPTRSTGSTRRRHLMVRDAAKRGSSP